MREGPNARKYKSANQISVILNLERMLTFPGTGVLRLAEYNNGRFMQKFNIVIDRRKIGTSLTFQGFS